MMHRMLSAPSRVRRGMIAAFVAVMLTVLVGVAALAVDGGLLQDNRRRVQAGADAAALAAASVLFQNYRTLTVLQPDPGSKAADAARDVAKRNGYPNDHITADVTVNIPPKTGPFTGKLAYVEVVVTYYQTRYFSAIWGTSKVPVSARAVGYGYSGGSGIGILVLDPTAKDSLDASGGGSLKVTGGARVIVDSNNAEAGRVTGGGSATASRFDIVGNYSGLFTGTVTTGVEPVPDPLAYLVAPAVPPDGIMTTTNLLKGNKLYTLTPGRYTNLPTFNQGDEVILKQASYDTRGGIYYIDGGGFNSTGASITMDPLTSGGVMIYNHATSNANNQGVQITGSSLGTVNVTALTSGPYAGILIWQDRTSTANMNIAGQGVFTLKGTFYTADSLLTVSGNGLTTVGSQYISKTLNISGSGGVNIDYTPDGTARQRIIRLVE